jgi:outer membrane protein TolC
MDKAAAMTRLKLKPGAAKHGALKPPPIWIFAIVLICLELTLALKAGAFNAPKPIRADALRLNNEPPPFELPKLNPDGTLTPASPAGIAPATGVSPPDSQNTQPSLRPPLPQKGQKLPPITPGANSTRQAGEVEMTVPTLTLNQSLDQALLQSPRVAAARALLDIQKALYAQAFVAPNPVLAVDNAPIAEQTQRLGVGTTYDPPWKVAFRLLAAKRQVKTTKLEILNTLWLFRNEVRRAYTEAVVAQEAYGTVLGLYELSSKLLSVAEKRYGTGDVPQLDVLKARLSRSQTEIDLRNGARRVSRAKQQLNVIMGNRLERQIEIPHLPTFKLKAVKTDLLPDFDRPPPPLRDLISEALETRLELRILKQQISLSQAQLYSAIGNIIPDPIVATGNSQGNNPAVGPKLTGYYVTLNMELPLFSYSQGEIARLKATIRQFYRQYHAQENQITAEVSAAYSRLLAARERIQVYQDHVLSDSEEVAHLAQLSYEVGESDITATLAAQQANVQVRSQYLDAIQTYQQAFTDLEQSMGEPLQ